MITRRQLFGNRKQFGFGAYMPPTVIPGVNPNAPIGDPSEDPPPQSPFSFDPAAEAAQIEQYFRAYGGVSLANQATSPVTSSTGGRSPLIEPPLGAQSYEQPGVIATPAVDGADHVIVSIAIPPNWDGVLKRIANIYSGPGLSFSTAGPGSMVWRLERNGVPIKTYENITFTFGSVGSNASVVPYDLAAGIPLYSGDVIALVCQNFSLPTPGTQVIGFLGGWFYPRQ